MPCTPQGINVAISIRTLEVYRRLSLRCPRLGVQPFIRFLCDMHFIAPQSYLATQFRDAYNMYLWIRRAVDSRVKTALGRDTPDWRLKHACPACLYKLEGEPELDVPLIITIDGNNSLKRYPRRTQGGVDADDNPVAGVSTERIDPRPTPGDYFIAPSTVDKWAKENLEELLAERPPQAPDASGAGEVDEEARERTACEKNWKNTQEKNTERTVSMWDETGIVMATCSHSFVLKLVDMVRSGEACIPFPTSRSTLMSLCSL
jgi:hypothetical protein